MLGGPRTPQPVAAGLTWLGTPRAGLVAELASGSSGSRQSFKLPKDRKALGPCRNALLWAARPLVEHTVFPSAVGRKHLLIQIPDPFTLFVKPRHSVGN